MTNMARMVSLSVLVLFLIFIAAIFYKVMASFILPLFLAVLLVVIFRPMHSWFINKCKGHHRIAAVLTTLSILVCVLAPSALIITQTTREVARLLVLVDRGEIIRGLEKLRAGSGLEPIPTEVNDRLKSVGQKLDDLHVAVIDNKGPEEYEKLANSLNEVVAGLKQYLAGLTPPENGRGFVLPPNAIALVDGLTTAVGEISQAREKPEDLGVALRNLDRAHEALQTAIYGDPFMSWVRTQVNLDREKLVELQEKSLAFAGPLALGLPQFIGMFLAKFLIGLIVMTISLYYFLADGPAILKTIMKLIPVEQRHEEELLAEFGKITRAMVAATLLAALAQALLAGIGYYVCGFESVFFLMVLTAFLAMIPFVGAASVWVSCSIWLFFVQEQHTAAILLALYGITIISSIDNVIKPLVLHGQSNLHPLLALLSVLGGVQALGPIGIFIGPMAVTFLHALLKIFSAEVEAMGKPAG